MGLKANLSRLTLRDVSNIPDAEHAIDSTLEHVRSLEHKCAEQGATLQLQAADLEAAHLAEGGPSLCIPGNPEVSPWDLGFSTVEHSRREHSPKRRPETADQRVARLLEGQQNHIPLLLKVQTMHG